MNTEGKYGCDAVRTFAAHTQSWVVNGKTVTAPATYAVELPKIYVQEHTGSGGTVAFVVIKHGKNDEIKQGQALGMLGTISRCRRLEEVRSCWLLVDG